jgi:hypothetical protein
MHHTCQFQMFVVTFEFYSFVGTNHHMKKELNGSILNAAPVINTVIASAMESEVGACFQNTQSGSPIRITLIEMRYKQRATPLQIKKVKNNGYAISLTVKNNLMYIAIQV